MTDHLDTMLVRLDWKGDVAAEDTDGPEWQLDLVAERYRHPNAQL